MAGRGAPAGNQNAARAKVWTAAIERALDKRGPSRIEALDALAEKFLAAVESGDIAAFREFGDRIQGKSVQPLEHSQDPDNPILPVLAAIEDVRKKIRSNT